MKIKSVFIVLFSIGFLRAEVPDPLTLDFCQEQARINYPLTKQSELLKQAAEQKIRNLTTNRLPQLMINGQAAWQSDVTKISINLPNVSIPTIDKDSYKLTLDISEAIYDGGAVSRQKIAERRSLEVDQKNLEVELFKLRERIDQVFFSGLQLQENKKLLTVLRNEIQSRLVVVESGVRNGTMLPSNADVLRAEIVKIDQQLLEIELGRESVLDVLGEYLQQTLPTQIQFALPVFPEPDDTLTIMRPELHLMDLQARKLDANKALLSVRIMPKVSIFGQLGYGRPGLNMLSNDFDTFSMFGARLSWTPWNWNQVRRDRQWFDFQKNIIQTQKETFEQQIRILLRKDQAEIRKYEALIQKDDEIIALRSKITRTVAAQFENGIVTATDYLTELNAETQARINKQFNLIRLVSAQANYLYDSGQYSQ